MVQFNTNVVTVEEQKSILIVEDDDVLPQTLAFNLEKEGYIIYTAPNGIIGLEQTREHKP